MSVQGFETPTVQLIIWPTPGSCIDCSRAQCNPLAVLLRLTQTWQPGPFRLAWAHVPKGWQLPTLVPSAEWFGDSHAPARWLLEHRLWPSMRKHHSAHGPLLPTPSHSCEGVPCYLNKIAVRVYYASWKQFPFKSLRISVRFEIS